MEFAQFLKESKNARKVFGKRELKIIEKQELGINLTQSEKNRLSRDIRKKLEFIKDCAKYQDEFGLKKGNEIKKLIEQAKEEILQNELAGRIKEIILFGSAVKNQLTFRSDIDLAVKFDKISLKEATQFRIQVSGRTSQKIDVQVYNWLPEKITKEIDKEGRVIYRK